MSKLKCKCGHTIADNQGNLTYKATLLPDTQRDDFFDDIRKSIKSLNDAREKGERELWISENFSVPPYPTDLPDQEMILDLITDSLRSRSRDIYQCVKCGRLLMELKGADLFIPFKPESNDWKEILNKE